MDGTVLVALAELKVLVSNLASRLEESIARNESRVDDHSGRIRRLEESNAVLRSKIESIESDEKASRFTFAGTAAGVAAIAAIVVFIMQLGSKIGW
jgi:demethoxyubiquinone hydroxylase (CLK1/Coq7/Cat5 family)